MHAHCNPSALFVTQIGPLRDYDASGRVVGERKEGPPASALPEVRWLESQPPHAIHILDSRALRLLRVELK